MTQALIELRDITKRYGQNSAAFNALRGINLQIHAGDFVAIMGASGSGKSTTMNILGCLDVATSGSYLFRDVELKTLNKEQRSLFRRCYLGFVFQGFNLLARTTALENVELPLLYRGESRRLRRDQGMAALERVGLAHRANHQPHQLSGGQQQRVAIARALVTDPQVLLADEPTGNLDTQRSIEIMELLTELNQTVGLSIILVTHALTMANYADRIVHFEDGLISGIISSEQDPHES